VAQISLPFAKTANSSLEVAILAVALILPFKAPVATHSVFGNSAELISGLLEV
jgi:hypothetical protein